MSNLTSPIDNAHIPNPMQEKGRTHCGDDFRVFDRL